MRRRTLLLAPVLGVLLVAPPAPAGARAATGHRHGTHRRVHRRSRPRFAPRAFASCRALVTYGEGHLALTRNGQAPPLPVAEASPVLAPVSVNATTQAGAPTPAAASAPAAGSAGGLPGPEFSTTNDQEAGVDEPDVAKTNGSTIFYVSGRALYAVAAGDGTPRLVGSLDLGQAGYGSELLLRGERLIVIERANVGVVPLIAQATPVAPVPGGTGVFSPYVVPAQTTVLEVDVADPSAMHVTRTMSVQGSFVDARQNGATARLVIASPPPAVAQPALRARAAGWLPARSFHSLLTGRRYTRPVAGCASVERPAQFSGLGMLTILTLDLDKGLWTAGSQALMADAQIVYGSPSSLYVATQRWIDPTTPVGQLPADSTVIDQFDATGADTTPLLASGEVPGYLLNQFSLSEYGGYLRAATTSNPGWWGGGGPVGGGGVAPASQSYVTVLRRQGATLTQVGQVGGLGQGQKIYSVRFAGNDAYVVTYRQIDPLYVVDLANPAAPAVVGQLELEGYSSYLHPLGGGLLLGVGSDVTANEPSAAQVELFDVSDPRASALLSKLSLGEGSSTAAAFDHHAFLWWSPAALAVLPVEIYPRYVAPAQGGGPPTAAAPAQSPKPFVGAVGLRVQRSGIAQVGSLTHASTDGSTLYPIERAIVIGSHLYTLGQDGVGAARLADLSGEGFAAFPAPPQPPPPQPGVASAPPASTHG